MIGYVHWRGEIRSSQLDNLIMNHHLLAFNFSRSTFEVVGSYFTYGEAYKRQNEVRQHFNYDGRPLDIVSSYELGRLEAIA